MSSLILLITEWFTVVTIIMHNVLPQLFPIYEYSSKVEKKLYILYINGEIQQTVNLLG